MDINEHLAVNVMGWRKASVNLLTNAKPRFGDVIDCYSDDTGECKVLLKDWNPPENIEQAFMCYQSLIRKGYEGEINSRTNTHDVYLCKRNTGYSLKTSVDLCDALSSACAKATGWEPNVS